MALFHKQHIPKIFSGQKIQTRRLHKRKWKVGKVYVLRRNWFDKGIGKILITRRFEQKLGEISPEDVKKEGYNSLEEFRRAWESINGEWNPEKTVTVYEFKLLKCPNCGEDFEIEPLLDSPGRNNEMVLLCKSCGYIWEEGVVR
ncbi:hypothetical protein J7L13_00515 [bacterium]|nr:hypothetical protein [bacterium]